MPVPDDFTAWLRLLETPGLGRAGARRLLAACGSPDAIFGAAAVTLRQIVGADVAAALARKPPGWVPPSAPGPIKAALRRSSASKVFSPACHCAAPSPPTGWTMMLVNEAA